MRNTGWLSLIAVFTIVVSCEKVIDIPLNEGDRRIVLEAVGKSLEGESYVLLSKTISSSGSSEGIERLSGAVVEITDEVGGVFLFEEDPENVGRYSHSTFYGLPNMRYDIKVGYQDVELKSNTRTITIPQIDSLFVYQDVGVLGDTTNVLIYTVADNPLEKNYYRFVLWVNGERNDIIFIETDDLGNGETYTSPFFGIEFDSGDEVYAELWSMDKERYDYFSALYTNLNQSPFSAAPSDLPSNIENGIGYFGVFMVDTMSILIP